MLFCPSCGGPAPVARHGLLEAPTCPAHGPCWRLVRTGFAAELVLFRDDAVLLCRRAIEPYAGYWGLPGGFVDPGEPPAEAARREALEEAGVDAKLEALVGLYGNWYVAGDWVMAAVYLGGFAGEPRADLGEIAEVRLFPVGKLPDELAWDHRQKIADATAMSESRL
jgi:8-oxo-dGTP diphosphatase